MMINCFGEMADRRQQCINSFQPSDAFHIETSHLICNANQMTGFYMECNNGRNGLSPISNRDYFLNFLPSQTSEI